MTAAADSGRYRIGAVARMTGIALPTLRMWERRYSVVVPARTDSGGRLYSRADVARLALLQAAVQAGHAIGTVAPLADAEIRARLQDRPQALAEGRQVVRLAVVGPSLPLLMHGPEAADAALSLVYSGASLDDEAALTEAAPDVLVIDLPTLHADAVEPLCRRIERIGAALTVVVYGFTGRRILRQLDLLNVLCIRAPADITQLLRICRLAGPRTAGSAAARDVPEAPPERRFSNLQLLRLASIDSAIGCECPQHLASLISSLSAFERYSEECASANAEDAVLHRDLHLATADARHRMERALERLLQAEGTTLPADGDAAVSVLSR